MTGADVGASHGRPEYVIPSLDLDGYFQRFFADRAALRERLGPPGPWPAKHVEPPPDPTRGIDDVESWILGLASHRELAATRPWRDGLDLLQKKFAVFGRVQRAYDANLRKSSDEEVSVLALCRLALLLLDRHEAEADLNSLNSAIKLLDKAAFLLPPLEVDPPLAETLSFALSREDAQLRRLRHG